MDTSEYNVSLAFERGKYFYLTFKMLIFLFKSRYMYATRDTMLSKAFPIPNSKAIPIKEGVHTFVRYRMKAMP